MFQKLRQRNFTFYTHAPSRDPKLLQPLNAYTQNRNFHQQQREKFVEVSRTESIIPYDFPNEENFLFGEKKGGEKKSWQIK